MASPMSERTEVEVAEHAIGRVLGLVVRRVGEEPAGRDRPVVGGRDREVVLRREVVEERALRHPRRRAQVVHGRGVETLGPDHGDGGVEQAVPAGAAGGGRHVATIPTGWYGVNTRHSRPRQRP